jgi:catechol 2,3-dioxygenase-like lactoylglutathione lyase family enzyme
MSETPVKVKPGVNHVAILASDVNQSVAFYRALFDFDDPYTHFHGGALDFEQVSLKAPLSESHHDVAIQGIGDRFDELKAGYGATLSHFALEVETIEDLARVREQLVALGNFEFDVDTGATKSVFGFDPDGNRFEVMWAVPRESWGDAEEHNMGKPLDIDAELESSRAT